MGAFFRGIPVLPAAVLLGVLMAPPAFPENLLANPGFEDRAADKPVRWAEFVQPKPGATAALSDEAHGGDYSVWLHTPTPYETEPVNNWSQNIIGDFGGETLRVSGFIRVEEADEAALWLQMWRKRPWGVLGAETTSTDMPVYGTADWQEVSMTVKVPEGADFVTVRCVLLGTGSAWFDDIKVTRAGPAPSEAPDSAAPDSAAPAVKEASGPAPPKEDAGTEATPADEEPVMAGRETVLPLVGHLESEVERLRDANVVLTKTLEEIQQVNQALLEEMLSVQVELRSLKTEKEAAEAPPLDPAHPRVPPLVPLSEAEAWGAP